MAGTFVDKENLLNDISKAFKGGFYSDVSFVLDDNSVVSTNKFMLACRVPYFAFMLFGGFGNESADNLITLDCCSSSIFKYILQFVGEGEVFFLDMNMQSLLDLLETSRFLCLDNLGEGVLNYWKHLIDNDKMDFKDCLVALDFTIEHKFTVASKMFLKVIDQNMSSIVSLPEFQSLTEISMKMLLKFENNAAKEIERFKALVKWLEKNSLDVNVKKEMLSWFDLNKFEKSDLVKTVRKTKLFDEEDICDVLEKHLNNLEQIMESEEYYVQELKSEHESLKSEFESLKKTSDSEKEQIVSLKNLNEKQKEEIKEIENVEIVMSCCSLSVPFGPAAVTSRLTKSVWKIPADHGIRYINKLEFQIGNPNYFYKITFKCSPDGLISWSIIDDIEVSGGLRQSISFQRKKMKYLAIEVAVGTRHGNQVLEGIKPHVHYVKALMI